ncbi:MAG: hypothetical protein ACRECH_15635 [Nitrososphaerales archaeon]
MTSERFTGILSCIEDALKPFGDSFSTVVFWNLKRTRALSREGLLDNPEAFRECLREIFGTGSRIVEQHIVLELKNRFNLRSEDLVDCARAIHSAKKQVLLVPTL